MMLHRFLGLGPGCLGMSSFAFLGCCTELSPLWVAFQRVRGHVEESQVCQAHAKHQDSPSGELTEDNPSPPSQDGSHLSPAPSGKL
jgi:hypothetical protein